MKTGVKGVNTVSAKGRLYFYHRKSGRPIHADPANPEKFAAEVAKQERLYQTHLAAQALIQDDSAGLLESSFIMSNADVFDMSPAVYFLMSARDIVYIGQSRSVYSRIAAHIALAQMKFTRVYVLWCNEDQLDDLERRYIAKFKPRYNLVHVFGRTPSLAGRGASIAESQ